MPSIWRGLGTRNVSVKKSATQRPLRARQPQHLQGLRRRRIRPTRPPRQPRAVVAAVRGTILRQLSNGAHWFSNTSPPTASRKPFASSVVKATAIPTHTTHTRAPRGCSSSCRARRHQLHQWLDTREPAFLNRSPTSGRRHGSVRATSNSGNTSGKPGAVAGF